MHGQLQRENAVIALVIGEAGENRGIGGQGLDAAGPSPALRHGVEEIIGEMHGVAGAAAIARDKYPAPFAPALLELGGELRERGAIQSFNDARQPHPVVTEMLLRG